MWYVPRSPPISIGGLYGEYLNKRSAARTAKKKSSEDFHPSECVREASLIDCVRDLECICETLLTLPKEVKSLRGRIHKLERIIQSTFYPSRVVKKPETLKKVIPQIEDYLQSTSEDEPDIKDHTSPKEDDDLATYHKLEKRKHYKHTYSSKQEDQIIRLVDQRKHDHISNMVDVVEQKIQSEIQRLYKHREARLNKIAEKDKQRKCLVHMNLFAHMKLAIERCVPKRGSVFSRAVVGRCKFPWCNDITVDRSFWNGLCALDDNRKGCLLDESLAMFHICSGVVTFYDSKKTEGGEYPKYKISFRKAEHVPKQSAVFGDCGVFLCMFLYRLANGILLALDDPLQSTLAY
ncbi:phospholipase-like protein [Tanacetum coccineum]